MKFCPVCQSEMFYKRKIYVCSECGQIYSEVNTTYDQKYVERLGHYFYHPPLNVFETIYGIVKPFNSLLDVGCGTGSFLRFVRSKDKFVELCGIDLMPNKDATITFIQGDLLKTELKQFDVVTAIETIEHIEDLHGFMRKIKSLAKKDGLIAITTPNNTCLLHKVARILNVFGYSTPFNRLYLDQHQHIFNMKSLRTLLESYDLEIMFHTACDLPMESQPCYGWFLRLAIKTILLFGNNGHQIIICRNI